MKIEVLCPTMFQKDLSKYIDMNIQTDIVYANQDDRHEYVERIINENKVKMITTPYRGVGENRNLALLYSNADIIVFSDDDMVYVDGYTEIIENAYKSIPDADIIIFNIGSIGENMKRRLNQKVKRVYMHNILNYGFPRVTIKMTSIKKANLWVSTLFGGGAKYSSGEDNLFLVNALKLGLKVYVSPAYIGSVKTGNSTWFKGLTEKYFFDKGAWLQSAFPTLKHLLVLYFAFKYSSRTKLTISKIIKLQYKGMKAFNEGMSYDEWFLKNETCQR